VTEMELAYGRGSVEFNFDEGRFSVLSTERIPKAPLKDFEIGLALDDPIASPSIDELVSSDDSVLIVVSDPTRATGPRHRLDLPKPVPPACQ